MLDRCRFVEAAAEDIRPIEEDSVDVVTTRSVLIYVDDKERAFREFARVLRPGGRISLYEPINRFGSGERGHGSFAGYPADGLEAIAAKVRAVYEAIQPRDSDPMLDFDERDLIRLAEQAGCPGGDRAGADFGRTRPADSALAAARRAGGRGLAHGLCVPRGNEAGSAANENSA